MELMAVEALNFSQELNSAAMCHLTDHAQFQRNAFCNPVELSEDMKALQSTSERLCEQMPLELSNSWAANHRRFGNECLPVVFLDQSTAAVSRNGVTADPAFPITYCEAVYKKRCSPEKTVAQISEAASCSVNSGLLRDSEKQKLVSKVFDNAVNKYVLQYICRKDVTSSSQTIEEKPSTIKPTSGSMEKNFTCSTCGESFKRRESLKRHVLRHTGEKPFICPVCNIKFCRKCQLTRHILVHTQEKPYECPDCGVRFRDKGNLNTHQLMHTGEKPFCCTVCSVRFRDRSNLKRHLLTHGGDKRFHCVLCSAKFKRKGDLKTHMLSHTGEKPFSCYICGTRFVVKSSLNKHLFTHTATKPFKCLVCGVAFQQLRYLKRHSALHTEEQPLDFSIRTPQ